MAYGMIMIMVLMMLGGESVTEKKDRCFILDSLMEITKVDISD